LIGVANNKEFYLPYEIGSCRGDDRKKEICNECDVTVISRIALLPGSNIEGCCGDLDNEHTIFYYKHKKSGDNGTFSVGKSCANTFVRILSQSLPQLVSPLQNMTIPQGSGGGGGSSNATQSITAPINSELYIAINLWCILKSQVPKYALQRILTKIQADPSIPQKDKDVFDFLKVVASYKTSLKDLLTNAQSNHSNIKNYSFPLINAVASKNWIDIP
jgi:hypothetical protein